MARRKSRALVVSSVGAAIAAAAQAACYWPIPSCNETTEKKTQYLYGDVTVEDAGAFQVGAQSYASCTEYCAAQLTGVRSIVSCNGPFQASVYPGGPLQWTVTCEVDDVSCHQPTIIAEPSFGSGRRPEGLPPSEGGADTVGAWLAEVARLEAASVPAFARLALELRAHGAPRALVRRARRSMRDEVRHARVTAALARAHGSEPRRARVGRLPVRDLRAIALENAVEGCVSETLGAIVAAHQAEHARDARVRAAFRRIARDEARHAELAWDVLAWCADDEARDALARAAARVTAASIAAPNDAMRDVLGLPDRVAAERMIAAARALLWEARGGLAPDRPPH